jgi:stage II sporulation protein AA (anti-sigma F factor antagonist)
MRIAKDEWGRCLVDVKFGSKGTTLVVKLLGELDHHCADYIRRKIDNELFKSSTKNMIFDFTGLKFMDSSGIGVIMGRYKNITRLRGRAVIVNRDMQIKRILEMSGILKMIDVYESVDKALSVLHRQAY